MAVWSMRVPANVSELRWQVSQVGTKVGMCLEGMPGARVPLWQAPHARGVPCKRPLMWQLVHSTVIWAPVSGKPVLKWSKRDVPCWARRAVERDIKSTNIPPTMVGNHADTVLKRGEVHIVRRRAPEQRPAGDALGSSFARRCEGPPCSARSVFAGEAAPLLNFDPPSLRFSRRA